MKKKESIDISASPEKVWLLLVKRENAFKIDRLIERFDYIGEKQSGEGAMVYMVKKADGRVIRSVCTITKWSENEKLAFHQILGDVKKMEVEYTIEPVETGCRVTLVHDVVMPYWVIGKIIGFIAVRPVMDKIGKEVVTNIKRLAET